MLLSLCQTEDSGFSATSTPQTGVHAHTALCRHYALTTQLQQV